MSATAQPHRADGHVDRGDPLPTRIFLQPIAAPSILGYFALASGLILFGTWLTGSWGTATSPEGFWPFVLLFSGVGQLAAAMWSYKARDAWAASAHGSWAAFWLGWGVLWLLESAGTVTIPPPGSPFDSLGMWWIYMAAITWTYACAGLATSPGTFLADATLATAAAIAAASYLVGSAGWETAAGWVFVAAAGVSFYIAAALMLDNVFGIVVLPLLRWRRESNVFGADPARPIQYEHGEPGVKVGQ